MFSRVQSWAKLLGKSRFGKIGSKSSQLARRRALSRALKVEGLEERRVFAGLVINEISVDPNGTDQPFEYVELKGIPNAPLTNFYFVSVEGDSPSGGAADRVYDLSTVSPGSNGLLVIAASGAGHTIPTETTIIADPAFNSGSALENGTNSFLLISSPTPIVQGSDLDSNNDGVLELPSGAVLVDAIGWTDGGGTDLAYGTILQLPAGNPTGAATRFLHDNRPNTAAAWYFGDLAAPNSGTAYTATTTSLSPNFPIGGALTPGSINVPGDANVAPVGIADGYQVEPGATLTVAVGGGVLSNDSDPNGVNSILAARLVSPPANATSFTFNRDGSFTYVSNGTLGIDSFTYEATDLNLFSTAVTVSINVATSSNVGPVLTQPNGPVAFTEEESPVALSPNATVADTDSSDFASGNLTVEIITNSSSDDRLEIRNEGSGAGQIGVVGNFVQFGGTTIGVFSGGVGTTPLVVNFSGNASVASVQATMRNVVFSNVSNAPSTLARTVRFTAVDGDGGPSGGVSNAVTQTVNVVAANDAPELVAARSSLTYAAGGSAVTLDGLVVVSDADLVDFNGGVLTASIAIGIEAGDSLGVRNTGSGPGQVGVSGNTVSFDGTVVGSIAGGTTAIPLTVTFNASANQEAVQGVARAIVFQTASPRLAPPPRTILLSLTDGDGGVSDPASYLVTQSQVRRFAFQEGVDAGQGVYSGAGDVMLAEARPTENLPIGGNPTEGLLVDFDAGTSNAAVLMRFDNLFGSAVGQIPSNAKVLSARLILDTNNPGDGGSFHRMLTTWDPNTATWNSIPATLNATSFPVRNDGTTARVIYDSQVGGPGGGGDTAAGFTTIGVKADIEAWLNGETNHGWLMQGWEGQTDGWAFSASESANAADRPRLEIDWVPATIEGSNFQQGLNGYAGSFDTALTQNTPDADNSALETVMFVDFNDAGGTNNSHVVMRFDSINGSSTGQVPAGALIHGASLTLASTANNGAGDGGQFYPLLQPSASPPTWNGFVDGITPDGIEAATNASLTAGNANRIPNVEGGWNSFDVTQDIQAWTNGTLVNNGWGIVPWNLGTDGWGIFPSEAVDPRHRPQLQVFFTPVGVTVTPISGLETSEAGGTASFSVVLNTPPTANVTIPLASSDTTEGTIGVTQLVFTPTNWDIPQLVTVQGVNDLTPDGNVAYQIITSPAVSVDANYSGVNASDVNVVNRESSTAAAVVNRGIFYNRSTSNVFGNGSGNPNNSIDSSKVPLLPGQAASFANVSNYVRGLNGVIFDIANPGGTISAADFQFAVSNNPNTTTFAVSAVVPTVTVFAGGGASGSSRVKIEFPDNTFRNTWLRVTALANANTGLAAADVFYFGSAVGEMNAGNLAGPPIVLRTNSIDTGTVRQNQSTGADSVPVTRLHDINKDGRVNSIDTGLVRQNQSATGSITFFTAPSSIQIDGALANVDSAMADLSWLESYGLEGKNRPGKRG